MDISSFMQASTAGCGQRPGSASHPQAQDSPPFSPAKEPAMPIRSAAACMLGLAALAAPLSARPAAAQAPAGRPTPAAGQGQAAPTPLRPQRDVAVTYRVTSGSRPAQTVPAAWLAASQRLRLEPPGMPGWVLVDLPSSQAQMVMDATRMLVRLPAKGPWPTLDRLPQGARMTPAGSATVAGLRCANWQVTSPQGNGQACLTADGVLLRASGTHDGQQGSLEATAVRYGAQDPARFQVPPGYQAVTLPQGLPPGLIPGMR
jgi:hypothetical protein